MANLAVWEEWEESPEWKKAVKKALGWIVEGCKKPRKFKYKLTVLSHFTHKVNTNSLYTVRHKRNKTSIENETERGL